MDAGHIVLAEDDPALRELLAYRLTSEGYDVRLLDTPRRLAECGDLDADLVISAFSDHGPTIHDVRQHSDVLLVAMMPTNTGVMDALDVVDAGADDVLVKPFSPRARHQDQGVAPTPGRGTHAAAPPGVRRAGHRSRRPRGDGRREAGGRTGARIRSPRVPGVVAAAGVHAHADHAARLVGRRRHRHRDGHGARAPLAGAHRGQPGRAPLDPHGVVGGLPVRPRRGPE